MASTLKPRGSLILAPMLGKVSETQQTQQAQQVIPQWTRPDDAEREARLNAMKRRATGLLAIALVIFVVASIYEPLYPWLGYVRATAEASLVGGLADWFAVTALFRHPLGLPIPHTAIVAKRKERIGQILGNFVQNHFLSREVIADNRQEELLSATVRLAAEAVRNNRDLIRERVRAETPWWVPPVLDDKIYQKIIVAVERLLHDMVMDPAHPLRTAFDNAIRDFIERLQHSPEVIARAEALKEEWLMGAQTDELARKLWDGVRQAVTKYATGTDGGTNPEPSPLDNGLAEFGVALLSNPTLLAEIDDLLIDVTAGVVEKYRHEIGDLIAQTVASWDPDATSRRFELAVGRDLQFVRINGTLVGGLVGLLIYSITRLVH